MILYPLVRSIAVFYHRTARLHLITSQKDKNGTSDKNKDMLVSFISTKGSHDAQFFYILT